MVGTAITRHMVTRRTGDGGAGAIPALGSTIRGKTITAGVIIRNFLTAPLGMRAAALTLAAVVSATVVVSAAGGMAAAVATGVEPTGAVSEHW